MTFEQKALETQKKTCLKMTDAQRKYWDKKLYEMQVKNNKVTPKITNEMVEKLLKGIL